MCLMDMLAELRLKAKKNQDRIPKEQTEPKEVERPLSRVFGFLRDRQEVRLGILYSIVDRKRSVRETESVIVEPKKLEAISYVS